MPRHYFFNGVADNLSMMNKQKKAQGVIFENPFLEKFTKTNPAVTIVFYTGIICTFLFLDYRLTHTGFADTVLLYIAGLFTWTLMEYILHRFVFHIDEYFPSVPMLKRLHYILHGIHHDHPTDEERLFMPPVPGTIIAFLMFGFWYLFLGDFAYAFMAGISNGYLLYSYIHYSIHLKPASPLFHRPWSHHAKHHFKYHDKAFGVSSPLWDIIFRTMPPKNKK
jgi:sterol desaturase/sphingolipid hydroxylase (fatty acid hydroxylase superfamily)